MNLDDYTTRINNILITKAAALEALIPSSIMVRLPVWAPNYRYGFTGLKLAWNTSRVVGQFLVAQMPEGRFSNKDEARYFAVGFPIDSLPPVEYKIGECFSLYPYGGSVELMMEMPLWSDKDLLNRIESCFLALSTFILESYGEAESNILGDGMW